MDRRQMLKTMGAACSALAVSKLAGATAKAQVPFEGTRESLKQYRIPDWFRDAKFGIWAHWGPQSAVEAGDWYARNMYMQGSEQYNYHTQTYGHPSKVGYKDVVNDWKAAKWDPDQLISLYKNILYRWACTTTILICGTPSIIAGTLWPWDPSVMWWAFGVKRRANRGCVLA